MTATNLVIAALAVWHIVEICHHGEIFATRRARAEVRQWFFDRVFLCPFCLSMWVAFVVTPFAMPRIEPVRPYQDDPLVWVWYGVHGFGFMVLACFAIARLANLGNDLTRGYCRTPNSKSTIETPDERPHTPEPPYPPEPRSDLR